MSSFQQPPDLKSKKTNLEKVYLDKSCHEVTSKTKYGTFQVLKSDYIGKRMVNGEHYEGGKINTVLQHLKPNMTVVDVGANYGVHAIPYGQAIGTEGELYCFEPQGIIYRMLDQNVKVNLLDTDIMNKDKVHVHHMALGHTNCITTLNGKCDKNKPIDYHRSQETNYGGLNLGLGGEQIEMRTLDSFGLKKFDYMKIDVEGAEKLVIYGARRTIEDYRPLVFYEENWKTLTKEMINMYNLSKNIINFNIRDFFLKELKYKTIKKVGTNYLAIP